MMMCPALKEQGNPEAAVPLLCQLANFNLVLARSAPTTKLEEPRQDRLGPELLLRQQYIDRASARFNEAAGLEQQHPLVLDARGGPDLAHPLSRGIDSCHPDAQLSSVCRKKARKRKRPRPSTRSSPSSHTTCPPRSCVPGSSCELRRANPGRHSRSFKTCSRWPRGACRTPGSASGAVFGVWGTRRGPDKRGRGALSSYAQSPLRLSVITH